MSLVAERSGHRFSIGQKIRVVIEDVSVVISDWVTGVATLSGVEAAVVGVVSISAFCGILGVDIT